jgi:uncharacterized repeat protein (TIGR01451 family)
VGIADVNSDGNLDLMAANYSGDSVSVLLGAGDGSFQPQTEYATDRTPNLLAVADFNADGRPDLVTANINGGSASVLEGNGDGTFQPKTDYAAGSIPLAVAVADVNADARPDVLIANNNGASVSVLLNTTAPTAVDLHVTKTTSPASTVTAGDAVHWTVTVSNEGINDAGAVTVTDTLPSKVSAASWTCAASSGSACAHASGSGGVNEAGSTVKAGGSITYTIAATVKPAATGLLTNSAGATPGPVFVDTDASDDSATTDATIQVPVPVVQPPDPVIQPPALVTDPPAAPEPPASSIPFAPPQITRLSVDHRCVRSATLSARAADAPGISFSFWLSQDATVSYEILRRMQSPRWSSCPQRGGTVPGTVTSVAQTKGRVKARRHDSTLAATAAVRTGGRPLLPTGLRRVSLARIAAGHKLAPGTYLLRITATNADGQAAAPAAVKFWVLGRGH